SGTIFRDKIFPFGCFFRRHSRALISSGSATINWRTQPLSSSQNCHPPELSIQWSYQLVRSTHNVRRHVCVNVTLKVLPLNVSYTQPLRSPRLLTGTVCIAAFSRSILWLFVAVHMSSKIHKRSCRASRKAGRHG